MDTLVSVVIPTFDRPESTRLAVESVASSRPALLEIVVVDDCGSIPFSYARAANVSGIPVRVLRLEKNVGAGMARKAGVEAAVGRYIAFLDSDDCYDKGWIDWAIAELLANPRTKTDRLIMSGIVRGARPLGAMVRKALGALPGSWQLPSSRLAAILFNPFFIQSILLDRTLCEFKEGLRYCEDYYFTSVALFRADAIVLPDLVACHLGRPPNSDGGLSAVRSKMSRGEMEVRRTMLDNPTIPLRYRMLVPCGMIYQVARDFLKRCCIRR